MLVRDHLNKAYWWEYKVSGFVIDWFLHTIETNLLRAHWANTPLLCRIIFVGFLNISRFNSSKYVGFRTKFWDGPWATCKDLLSHCIIFLFNPLPYASELIVGYQFLSETALRTFFILYIKLGHIQGLNIDKLTFRKNSQLGGVGQKVSKLGQKWTTVCL